MVRFFVVALLAVVSVGGNQTMPFELTVQEEKAVIETAEKALKARDLWRAKTVLTNTELVFNGKTDPPQRCALLTYYRYDGDLAILVLIDVKALAVVKVQTHAHMPTSLTTAEIAEADKIARLNPEIRKALARYAHLDRIETDTMAARIIDANVPGYQHRVARLFFRDAKRNYLPNVPMVDVDLTTGEVRFDLIRGMHGKK